MTRSPAPGPHRGRWIAAAIVAALSGPAVHAVEPNIYINRGEWFSALSGNGTTGDSGPDRDFDLDQTFDLDLDSPVASLDSFLRVGRSRFLLSWTQGRNTGTNKLKDPLVFDGTTFPAGDKLRTTTHLERWRAMYGRPLLNTAKLAIGFLAGLEDYIVEQDARASGTGSETVKVDSRVPIIGASLTWLPARFFRIYGEATGTNMSSGGVDSRLINAYVRAEYDLYADLLALSVGYHYAITEVQDEDEADFDLQQKGLTAGLTFKL
jgi:hypothetical protein